MARRVASVGKALALAAGLLSVAAAGSPPRIRPTGYPYTDRHMLVNEGEPVDVTGRRIHAFVFLGQSNMVGRAPAAEFPRELIAPDPRVLRLEDGGWVVQRAHKRRNGPEIAFAHAMARAWPGETIGIVKVALGGTGIRAFVPDWSDELAERVPGDGRKGPLYRILRRRIELARRLSDIEFRAVFWKQGGTDMRWSRTAENYVEHLERIIGAIRRDAGDPGIPLFVATYATVEGLRELESPRFARLLSRVEAAPKVIAAHNRAADLIAHTETVVHGTLPTRDGRGHFTTEGQIRLGELLAARFLATGSGE